MATLRSALSGEGGLIAASIAYFTFMALFPLILLLVAFASLWLDPLLAETEIVAALEFAAPGLQGLLGANLQNIVVARAPASGLAIIMLIWSSSSIFNILTRALDRAWAVDTARPGWHHRGLAILVTLVVSGLVLFTMVADGILKAVGQAFPLPPALLRLPSFNSGGLGTMLNVVVFSGLYYILPHRQFRWADVLPGALLAGVLWQGAKRGFLYFVTLYLSRSNLVYGSVATVIAFLTWAYFSGYIFMLGVYFNVNYARLRQARPGSRLPGTTTR